MFPLSPRPNQKRETERGSLKTCLFPQIDLPGDIVVPIKLLAASTVKFRLDRLILRCQLSRDGSWMEENSTVLSHLPKGKKYPGAGRYSLPWEKQSAPSQYLKFMALIILVREGKQNGGWCGRWRYFTKEKVGSCRPGIQLTERRG